MLVIIQFQSKMHGPCNIKCAVSRINYSGSDIKLEIPHAVSLNNLHIK
jgi:hypothetical protein